MAEKEENKKGFSTCLEGIPLAEMMQKMIGQQGNRFPLCRDDEEGHGETGGWLQLPLC